MKRGKISLKKAWKKEKEKEHREDGTNSAK